MYYLKSRYYDPETGRFINADDIEILSESKDLINGLNLYIYCSNNPVKYTDNIGKWFLIDDLIAAFAGLVAGVVGTLIGDLTTILFTGEWQFSPWETYLGSAIGGAVGGLTTLYMGPIAGVAIGTGIGTFIGQGLEILTGTNVRTLETIILNSLLSVGIATVAAGFTKFLKIPGITSGSHSFAQVWKSGVTKCINYGFNISFKTISKGFISSLISEFTIGWLIGNIIEGSLNAIRINWANMHKKYNLINI